MATENRDIQAIHGHLEGMKTHLSNLDENVRIIKTYIEQQKPVSFAELEPAIAPLGELKETVDEIKKLLSPPAVLPPPRPLRVISLPTIHRR